MLDDFQVKYSAPDTEVFLNLRRLIGWENPDLAVVEQSIKSSLFWVTISSGQEVVAVGRIVGDGFMYFYVQDIIVHPQFQGKGLGALVMQHIESYLLKHCSIGATIGLLAAQGKEGFYEKFGYKARDGSSLGMGMCKFIF